MKLRMCHCQHCKYGRRNDTSVRQKAKGARSKVRRLLHRGEYDRLPVSVAIGYTD